MANLNEMTYQERAKELLTKEIKVVPFGNINEKIRKLIQTFVVKIDGKYLSDDGKITKFDTESGAKQHAKEFKEKLQIVANGGV